MYRGERFNSYSHLIGTLLAVAGLVVLVVVASLYGNAWQVVSVSIYGATLVMLYGASTLYHSIRHAGAKKVLQKFDHCAIYLLIAGSYTPFSLVTLRGPWGWTLFGISWGLALIGIIQELLIGKRTRVFSLIIYVLMGWLILIAMKPLKLALPAGGMAWLVAGGVIYSIGIIFFIFDEKIRHGHGIWHLFVLAGSVCHFFSILLYVA
ncbi:PAQR family membrane homeostasis protein TrhA [Jeongeupia naejangsanensis]|uniref:Hemolysin III family protein n=1 Tax=Jeongeupia naejangsanensis TaxID=613195 RepID=A0ABS2BL52_9NEIS|nr:hemolysin III family protein [Jeongeupia naejangsanensis]MBM3115716.1 hemolysin III family protein [Jeongeupia naejangsanensis]